MAEHEQDLDKIILDTSGEKMHTHDGVHYHSHHDSTDGHTHSHGHTHANTKQVLNRMNRAIGHMESIKRMVEDGRDCTEVLIQIAAVRSAPWLQ